MWGWGGRIRQRCCHICSGPQPLLNISPSSFWKAHGSQVLTAPVSTHRQSFAKFCKNWTRNVNPFQRYLFFHHTTLKDPSCNRRISGINLKEKHDFKQYPINAFSVYLKNNVKCVEWYGCLALWFHRVCSKGNWPTPLVMMEASEVVHWGSALPSGISMILD